MDSITQATLGASIGHALLGKKLRWKASVLGAGVATIPDLDVLLTPFFTEIQKVSLHRGYSHSVLFITFLSLFLYFILRKRKIFQDVSSIRLILMLYLTLLTHLVLDTFTSYGTQLFLPFTDWRVSFDSISIIDPFYTVPLLLGLLASLWAQRARRSSFLKPNTIGLILSSLYLAFTLVNKTRVDQEFNQALNSKSISTIDLLTVPVKVGNVHWYGVGNDGANLHIGQYNILKKEPINFQSFPINDHLLDEVDSEIVDRMRWFAKDFYTVAKLEDKIRIYNMQCDMQGIRTFGDYRAPTAFYYEIYIDSLGSSILGSGMHK